jgi:glycosyltransferase involved in cell wall biosynthesis
VTSQASEVRQDRRSRAQCEMTHSSQAPPIIGIDASRTVLPQRTGTEVYSLYLIRRLIALAPTHRFRLYFNAPPPPDLIPSSTHCELRPIPFPRLWTHLRLSFEMLAQPPDVLFVPSHVLPLVHPRRSVVTVHDLGHRYHPETHTSFQRWYLEWSTRYHVRAAAHIVADSGATKDDLIRLYGANPARITVAYLGVDERFGPVRDVKAVARVKHRYGIAGPYLLYVGTLQPRKNLARLVEAFAQVVAEEGQGVSDEGRGELKSDNSQRLGLQLVLAGKKGWLYEDITAQAQALGLEGKVVLTGYVDEEDLPALYTGATLFVTPSLYEGFCLPVLEAMACCTPVACSDASSLPEVVGDAALQFDPLDVRSMAQSIVRGIGDRALRSKLVARGIARTQLFTWHRCAQHVLEVLEQVAQSQLSGC